MSEYVSTDGDAVPEIVFEAYLETLQGNVVHVKVTGTKYEFETLINRFTTLCRQHKDMPRGYVHEY